MSRRRTGAFDKRALADRPGWSVADRLKPCSRLRTWNGQFRSQARWARRPRPRPASPGCGPAGRPCPVRARAASISGSTSLTTPGAFLARARPSPGARAGTPSTGSSAWRTAVSWIIRLKLAARPDDRDRGAQHPCLREGEVRRPPRGPASPRTATASPSLGVVKVSIRSASSARCSSIVAPHLVAVHCRRLRTWYDDRTIMVRSSD